AVCFCAVRRAQRATLFPYTTLFRSSASIVSSRDAPPCSTRSTAKQIGISTPARRASAATDRAVHTPSATEVRAARISLSASPLRSEEHTSELQSRENLVCRLLLDKK